MTKTVKCKIALAVDSHGSWTAIGFADKHGVWTDGFAAGVLDGVEEGEARYYVLVEVPVPEVREIEGEVSRG